MISLVSERRTCSSSYIKVKKRKEKKRKECPCCRRISVCCTANSHRVLAVPRHNTRQTWSAVVNQDEEKAKEVEANLSVQANPSVEARANQLVDQRRGNGEEEEREADRVPVPIP